LKICEAKSDKSSIDEPPEVELKDLPPHLEYSFLEGEDKLPVIIAKDLSVEEKTALIMVLKSHKRAIAWKLSDIKGVDPEFCTHKILMEEDFEPAVQHQEGSILKSTMTSNKSFQTCLSYEKILKRCKDTNLCLNWEKSHFMVKEGIVLGHKISKNRIEVDKAKVDVIAKLPHLTTVKDTQFFFSKECVEAFQTLKRKLTEASILIALDLDMPFELMCDASNFAIGAVLGQHQEKNFRPIHYASKTMTEAKSNYTTTEKEMLAVVKPLTLSRLATMDPPETSRAKLHSQEGENCASWSDKLDIAFWAFRTAYKTQFECTPYKLVYGKACRILIELEHKAYWALKHANFDL
nr:reverse transcriptase domain-containing protein [Tanacetum cinerariifolium]